MMLHLIQPRMPFGPEERRKELIECWDRNDLVFRSTATPLSGRPTFNELFGMCLPDMVNVIANSDIYFASEGYQQILGAFINEDGSIRDPRQCFALSRWDISPVGTATHWNHADSQDVWIIHGTPMRPIDADFAIGTPGCDNRLAHELDNAGYVLTNPSLTIRAYHLHNCQWRSYLDEPTGIARGGRKIERVPPPYRLVQPTYL